MVVAGAYSLEEVGSDLFASYSVEAALCQVAFDDSCYHSFYWVVEVAVVEAEVLYYPLEIYLNVLLLQQGHSDSCFPCL